MHVFYCNNIFEHPQTGGEMFYAQLLNYLRVHKDIELNFPSATDLYFLNQPKNCLGINWYFLKRFKQLPRDTIVIESEFYFYNFFLTNWLIKLWRRDLRILAQICQVPDILLLNSKARWIRRIMMFAFLRRADGVAVLSQSQKEQMVKLGARRERTHVVYIAGQSFEKLGQHRKKKKQDRWRIICVAHIRPRKGQKVLIEALKYLRDIPFEAIFVGGTKDEEYESEVRMLIEKYAMEKEVRFTGLLEGKDLAMAYVESDIFVLPSYHEPYGIVVQEAMSFGLPVVASNVDGIPEQVTAGTEGFLVPPGDPVALAEALRKIIVDIELYEAMGQRARQRASELPTWDEVCDLFYRALIAAKQG